MSNGYSIDEILAEVDKNRKKRLHDTEETPSRATGYAPQTVVNDGFSPENTAAVTKAAGQGFRGFYEWLENLVVTFVCIVLVLTFFVRLNEVSGESMLPTLEDGDRILVYELGYTPQYNDVVIIQAENLPNALTGEMGEGIVKRVIGLEGDIIDIDKETGTVYRNGEALTEDFIAEAIRPSKLGNAVYPVTVGENEIFVLGDNRNHSTDSRYVDDGYSSYYVGCVSLEYVIGKAFFIIFPLDRIGGL